MLETHTTYLTKGSYLSCSLFENLHSCRLLWGIRSSLKRNHGYYRFTSTWRARLVKLNRARASERAIIFSREIQQGQFNARVHGHA